MHQGSPIEYVDSRGSAHEATADAIAGTGPSLFKRLDLTYVDGNGHPQQRKGVPHEHDAAAGKPFWRERTAAVVVLERPLPHPAAFYTLPQRHPWAAGTVEEREGEPLRLTDAERAVLPQLGEAATAEAPILGVTDRAPGAETSREVPQGNESGGKGRRSA